MFQLTKTEERQIGTTKRTVRVYRNTTTGNEVTTYLLHVDEQKRKWWAFEDLYSVPHIRMLAANKIVRLYGNDLSLDDITAHTTELKAIMRSADAEKYEKAYAKVLELEKLSTAMADPVKQSIGLCTLYLLMDEERPDVYNQAEQAAKMSILALDVDLQTFFLNWWIGVMQRYGKDLKVLSLIASSLHPSATSTPAPLS